MPRWTAERVAWTAVIAGATLIALVSARPFAGGWNDGSRVAMIESLVDRHTLAIDESIFVNVSPGASPFETTLHENVRLRGTFDKLRIDGHYYSDKSPLPGLLLALIYQMLQSTTGLTARVHPQVFCYLMTVLSSGIAYVTAVAGVFQLSRMLRLSLRLSLGVTASFALGTLALVYVRYVNNHMMLLGVTVGMLVCHVRLAHDSQPGWMTLLALGSLAGFAYTIDLGVGPPLLAGSFALAAWRTWSVRALAIIALALPWVLTHHAVNYAVGGTIKPANAVPEYLAWPGSPFKSNATGHWSHANVGHCASYAIQLLVGKKGFLGHNLPLFLAIPAVCLLLQRRSHYVPEVLFCVMVSGGVWLVYSVGSTNYSGACLSVRWFVPLVGLGFFVIIALLGEDTSFAVDLGILSIGGIAMMLSAWPDGPWRMYILPTYWPVLAVTLAAWGAYRWRKGGRTRELIPEPIDISVPAKAA